METIIQKALKILLDKFGASYDCVTVSEENGHYRANIETEDPGRLIGRNGASLQALQTILKNILWEQNEERVFVSLDVDGYKKSQEDKMINKVRDYIKMMEERNLSETKLPPMSAYYRRIIHSWIATEYPQLTSDSEGEGRDRAIRVFYK